MRARITGTGMYVPPLVVSNDDLTRIMDTSDEWIRVRTGIEERRFVEPGEATSDIALPAARDAIADAAIDAGEIDYLIVATMTPDHYFPGSAPALQHALGLDHVPCLDIRQQCAGFVYGLQLADALIRSGCAKSVLLVGAEVHSCFLPWQSWDVLLGRTSGPISDEEYERNTATRDRTVLFGDGAGAVVVQADEHDGIGVLDVILHTNGAELQRLWTPAGGSRYRPYFDTEMISSGAVTPIVQGRKVYALAVTHMPQVALEVLEKNNLTLDEVDLVIMHQANLRINEGVQKRLGLDDDRVFNNIQRYGNTTAATIPIALHEARAQGRVKDGDLVCFIGLGSGLNWGAALHRC